MINKWEIVNYDDNENCIISNHGGLWTVKKCPYCNIMVAQNVMIMGNSSKYGMNFCPNCGKHMIYEEGDE